MNRTFTIHDDQINIEEIMDEIRKYIRERGLTENQLLQGSRLRNNMEDYQQIDKLNHFIDLLHRTWNMTGDKEIKSHRVIIGKMIVLAKKIIRKVIRWYIQPVWDQQTEFNANNVHAINELAMALEELLEQHRELREQVRRLNIQAFAPNIQNQTKKKLDIDYFNFEMKYRGPRDEIKERQSIYLKYFLGQNNVLDLGCGRGEFTELLLENKISVQGVDINEQMVNYCQGQGLTVTQADIFEYLEQIPDQSLGGIFLGQVIEHLSTNQLVELVKLSYKKLKPDSYFIAETPNPECLAIFAQSFYLDFTHEKPVHPLSARFVLETNGFKDVEVVYSTPMPDDYHISPDLENSDLDSKTILALRNWNRVLFGNQDYAIIGRK